MSDAETEQRVLAAALDVLADQGITVGLDGLRFEEVIRAADVSRTSAYRRWPSREAFLDDVLLQLARGSELPHIGEQVQAEAAPLLSPGWSDLTTAAGRHDLFVELLRLAFAADVGATFASPQFQTYLALRAAFLGVPSEELRTALAEALVRSERRAVARGRAIIAGAAHLFARRLVPPLAGDEGYDVVARTISAATNGFVVAGLADPALIHDTRALAPYGSTRTADWSVPVLALAGIVLGHLEDDPDAPVPTPESLVAALPDLVRAGAAAAAAV
ncbi:MULTISPECIES: TetR/AcrR family transcriptional regulator [unclassified Actinotalea]|uniref:TetR/AcrR family transcriptional regulator n=1 Tax=unclassified Actinotalea TaxID=2638618 RepID=UPI0015F45104|nr:MULTISPECIES: TetR/AcrR family transcriptional regulator [unclassified Actinotalea]